MSRIRQWTYLAEDEDEGKTVGEREFAGEAASLVECFLETGRTHQIRVHMAYMGHPLFGDCLYGMEDKAVRLWLHAWRICLCQPFTGKKIEVCAPLPKLQDSKSDG